MSRRLGIVIACLAMLFASVAIAFGGTGGSGGPHTAQLNASYTNASGTTSQYHLFAAGLDWSKPVGLMIYADGSGEYGLKNPNSNYLLDADGSDGLVAVAKRHNLVLLTPRAPGGGCPDGGGECWYQSSGGQSVAAKTRWAFDLAQHVKTRYDIDLSRVVVGGYSSGAQFTTEFFMPQYGEQTMSDGLMVAISYGGSPKVPASFTPGFKSRVAAVWDTGANDSAYTTSGSYGVKAGERWYRENGFATELNVVAGLGHGRSGQFDAIMDREIAQHVGAGSPSGTTPPPPPPPPSSTTTPPPPPPTSTTVPTTPPSDTTTPPPPPPVSTPWTVTIEPTAKGGSFHVTVPDDFEGWVSMSLSSGGFVWAYASGPEQVTLRFEHQRCDRSMTWTLRSSFWTVRNTGTFRTLAC